MRRYATPNGVGDFHPRVETRGYRHSLAPRGSTRGFSCIDLAANRDRPRSACARFMVPMHAQRRKEAP